MEVRHRFSPRMRVQRAFEGPSLAKQSMKDECDINVILARYRKTGLLGHVSTNLGSYLELPSIDADYHDCLNFIIQAQEAFEALPAHVRKRFENDPAQFLEFAEDPENLEEMRQLGLAHPVEVQPAIVEQEPEAEPEGEQQTSTT